MTFRPVKPREHGSTAEVVGRAYEQIGGAKRAAIVMGGLGLSQTYGYTDPAVRDANISLDQARQLTVAGATSFAEIFALEAGGYFTPGGERSGLGVNELLARAEEAQAQIVANYLRGLEAGKPPSNRDILKLIDATLRAVAELRAELHAGLSA